MGDKTPDDGTYATGGGTFEPALSFMTLQVLLCNAQHDQRGSVPAAKRTRKTSKGRGEATSEGGATYERIQDVNVHGRGGLKSSEPVPQGNVNELPAAGETSG